MTLCEKFYPAISEEDLNIRTYSSQYTLANRFKALYPDAWAKILELNRSVKNVVHDFTCLCFFEEKASGCSSMIRDSDFNFTSNHFNVSDDITKSYNDELDVIIRNITVTFSAD